MKLEGLLLMGVFFIEVEYPFTIKPNFSTPGSIIEISRLKPLISFLTNDSIRNLGFNASTIYEKYNLSPNSVDILSFDKMFFETDIAH